MMPAMGMARREPITDDQLRSFKYFKKLLPLLDRLHDAATARDRAPTLRTVEMIRFYFTGWADLGELEAPIAKLQAPKA